MKNDEQQKKREFAKRLVRYVTDHRKISQSELAKQLGFSQQAYSNRIQRGTVSYYDLSEYMKQHKIPVPSWAAEDLENAPVATQHELELLRAENERQAKRIAELEHHAQQLFELLQLAIEKR